MGWSQVRPFLHICALSTKDLQLLVFVSMSSSVQACSPTNIRMVHVDGGVSELCFKVAKCCQTEIDFSKDARWSGPKEKATVEKGTDHASCHSQGCMQVCFDVVELWLQELQLGSRLDPWLRPEAPSNPFNRHVCISLPS